MTEKTYKVMGLAGGANIAIGIISIVDDKLKAAIDAYYEQYGVKE